MRGGNYAWIVRRGIVRRGLCGALSSFQNCLGGGREREPSWFRLAEDLGSVAQVRIGLRILLAPSGLAGAGLGGAARR